MIEAIIVISFAALIYSGPLSAGISSAVSLMLAGNAILVLVASLFSTYSGSIALTQDTPAVLLALAAAAIGPLVAARASSEAHVIATVLVAVIGATMLMGLIFMGLGIFRIGRFVRFLPYPVMGGFLAGTGWLLVQGGIGVMTNMPFSSTIFTSSVYSYWLPGIALAVVMFVSVKKKSTAPGHCHSCLDVVFGLFYLVMGLMRAPVTDWFSNGWLLDPFSTETRWAFPLNAGTFALVDWQAILQSMALAAPLFLICPVALLLNVSGLELIARQDMNINRELITTGIGNVAAGLTGGIIGYHAVSLSSLNKTISNGRRLPGILTAVFLALTVVVGVSFLPYIPRMLLGSLVVFIGLSLLYDWTFKIWSVFPKIDILIILAILATIMATNFLWSILVGMVMTIIMFVFSYSKINIIKYSLTGKAKRSRVTRSHKQSSFLWSRGDQLVIYMLEGLIFFGTANDLYERIRLRILSSTEPKIRYFVLDFAQVSGVDSTGLLYFQKTFQVAQEQNTKMILTGLNPRVREQFHKGGYDENTPGLKYFSDLDHGLEWYEDQVIHLAQLGDQKHLRLSEY
jgi:SulP family sulfate permease